MSSSGVSPDLYGPRPGVIAPLPLGERGVAIVTAASPNGQYFIYSNGTNVIVRDVENPDKVFVYGEHSHPVKSAKFAPSGYYVASGDASGKVRVWAWNNVQHTLKFECPALGGEVEDVAWCGESKRILAVGGGQSKAKVFAWDTGSNLGNMIPHTKKAITGDIKPNRPFTCVTGSEDFSMSFYEGPPFKYKHGIKEHGNFVNCARYSPDGTRFASVSSDKTGLIFDGVAGTLIGKLDAADGHTGSIFSVSWSPDGKQLVTSGGDKTIRIWDVSGEGPTFPLIASYTVGSRPDDMQQSVVWVNENIIISTALEGTLYYFNPANIASGPTKIVPGHQAPATTLAIDPKTGALYTGCDSGKVFRWAPIDESRSRFTPTRVGGEGPSKKVSQVAVSGTTLCAVAWDDKLRIGDAVSGAFSTTVDLKAQPKGLALTPAYPELQFVITSSNILVIQDGEIASTTAAGYTPVSLAVSPDGAYVAVGGTDKKIYVYSFSDKKTLTQLHVLRESTAAVSALAFSPDSQILASADSGRGEVRLHDPKTGETTVSGRWMNHTTRVSGLAWSPNGQFVGSVSTDRRFCIWKVGKIEGAAFVQELAHPQPLCACAWASDSVFWTLGTDGVLVRRDLTLE